jgi:hypothetical protein
MKQDNLNGQSGNLTFNFLLHFGFPGLMIALFHVLGKKERKKKDQKKGVGGVTK